ncbi:MAG TPA: GNAT family N-acetyltransferase, partial [Symbiobacteriaceae bacterium]|nr:GNAT family N-acetyltransferase [Symbiobacteriaceae bacterium]
MAIQIRPLVPDDYAAVVGVLNVSRHVQTTVEDKAGFVADWRQGFPAIHLIAESDGQITGYAVAYKASWIRHDHIYAQIAVEPQWRCRGVGSALAAALEPFVQAQDAAWLTIQVQDDDLASMAWAERRGFVKRHHFFES